MNHSNWEASKSDTNGLPDKGLSERDTIREPLLSSAAMHAGEAFSRALLQASSEGIVTLDHKGQIVEFNPAAEAMFGYTRAQVAGTPVGALLVPPGSSASPGAGGPGAAPVWRRSHVGQRLQTSALRADGSDFPVEVTVLPLEGVEPPVFAACVRDLSERQRVERSMHENEHRLRFALEAGQVGTWEMDLVSGRVMLSDNHTAMLGLPRERLPATYDGLLDGVHPDDRDFFDQATEQVSNHGLEFAIEYRVVWPDGSLHWITSKGRVMRDQTGQPLGLMGACMDITQRKQAEEERARSLSEHKRLEEQLRQAQKMEAIGQLAGGVAHDFNNLLTVIQGYSSIVAGQLPADHSCQPFISEVRDAGERAAALTSRLLLFSRKQVSVPEVLNLDDVVASLEKLLRRLIGEDIELITRGRDRESGAKDEEREARRGEDRSSLAPNSRPFIKADASQIEQVILNLAVNARDAMPQGGKLTIETANVFLDAGQASPLAVAPGEYVELTVSDTGYGMDAATQARIFEPFFTTKGAGKGTGLGLATVYGIINQCGGQVTVESRPAGSASARTLGQGTTFKIYLPRVQPADLPASGLAAAEKLLPGNETILLVEDDASLRKLARQILEMHGYTVLEAESGTEAVHISARYTAPIPLLVTDVVMPQMSGRQLARQLTAQRPEMDVLYLSGYTEEAIVHHGVLEAGMAFLQKPFMPSVLARKVREVLDRPM
jgi:PAS domain S-box-containing protein